MKRLLVLKYESVLHNHLESDAYVVLEVSCLNVLLLDELGPVSEVICSLDYHVLRVQLEQASLLGWVDEKDLGNLQHLVLLPLVLDLLFLVAAKYLRVL